MGKVQVLRLSNVSEPRAVATGCRHALAAYRRFFTIRSLPLAVLTRVQPGCNLVHNALMDLLRRHTGALRNFERMITAFDHVKLSGQAKLLNHAANFLFCSKRIARALHE